MWLFQKGTDFGKSQCRGCGACSLLQPELVRQGMGCISCRIWAENVLCQAANTFSPFRTSVSSSAHSWHMDQGSTWFRNPIPGFHSAFILPISTMSTFPALWSVTITRYLQVQEGSRCIGEHVEAQGSSRTWLWWIKPTGGIIPKSVKPSKVWAPNLDTHPHHLLGHPHGAQCTCSSSLDAASVPQGTHSFQLISQPLVLAHSHAQ